MRLRNANSVNTNECAKLLRKQTGWMTKSSCLTVAMSHRCSTEKLPRDKHHEHSETSWQDSRHRKYPMRLVKEVLKALRAQLMLRGVVSALQVVEPVEEDDVVTAATKGGQHKDVGQFVLEKHVRKKWPHMRRLKVCLSMNLKNT